MTRRAWLAPGIAALALVLTGIYLGAQAQAIVGAYLWGADQILKPFVRDVLLGQ